MGGPGRGAIAAALGLLGLTGGCGGGEGLASGSSSSSSSSGSGGGEGTTDGGMSSGATTLVPTGAGESSGSSGGGLSTGSTTGTGTTGTTGGEISTGVMGVCGDGVRDVGEACDDGDGDDTDECTHTCAAAACGDGVVWAGVELCDDGDVQAGDGCDGECLPEGLPDVYLASALSDFGFHGYFAAADAWVTLAGAPSVTYSQLTNDGERVYLLGIDNVIHVYSPAEGAWSSSPVPGPGAELVNQPTGYFKWTDDGFYYLQDGLTTLYHHKDGAWAAIGLPNVGSCAGSWAPGEGLLFMRSYLQTGFMAVRTSDDMVVRSITDVAPIPETNRTGSLSGAFFYVRGMFGPLERLDAVDGMKTNTGQFPASPQTASDTDLATGAIYLAGYQAQATIFQRYDPEANAITTLAASPAVPDLSTITVMLP